MGAGTHTSYQMSRRGARRAGGRLSLPWGRLAFTLAPVKVRTSNVVLTLFAVASLAANALPWVCAREVSAGTLAEPKCSCSASAHAWAAEPCCCCAETPPDTPLEAHKARVAVLGSVPELPTPVLAKAAPVPLPDGASAVLVLAGGTPSQLAQATRAGPARAAPLYLTQQVFLL
jgi:hypothetical protein